MDQPISAPIQRFILTHTVARLATSGRDGQPHVIPFCYAFDGERFYFVVDEKPKRVAPSQLKRMRNLLVNPQVAVVVDQYDEDWVRLAWVLVTGRGEIVESGAAHATGIGLLQDKYPQYRAMPLTQCPLIVVTPLRVTSWGALLKD